MDRGLSKGSAGCGRGPRLCNITQQEFPTFFCASICIPQLEFPTIGVHMMATRLQVYQHINVRFLPPNPSCSRQIGSSRTPPDVPIQNTRGQHCNWPQRVPTGSSTSSTDFKIGVFATGGLNTTWVPLPRACRGSKRTMAGATINVTRGDTFEVPHLGQCRRGF